MALSDLIIKQAKPREKRYTLSDGQELILEVHPNGRKYWVIRLWRDGKERRRSAGSFLDIPLKAARERAQELCGALQARVVKHMATITNPQGIAALMRNIAAYPRFIVRCIVDRSIIARQAFEGRLSCLTHFD